MFSILSPPDILLVTRFVIQRCVMLRCVMLQSLSFSFSFFLSEIIASVLLIKSELCISGISVSVSGILYCVVK